MHAACVNKKVKLDLHAANTKTQMESGDCDAICTLKAADELSLFVFASACLELKQKCKLLKVGM